MLGSTLLPLRGGGWGSNFQEKKRYVALEWPLRHKLSVRIDQVCLLF